MQISPSSLSPLKMEQTLYTMSEDPWHKPSTHHKYFKRENRFCLSRPNSKCQVKYPKSRLNYKRLVQPSQSWKSCPKTALPTLLKSHYVIIMLTSKHTILLKYFFPLLHIPKSPHPITLASSLPKSHTASSLALLEEWVGAA
jgi:hypothetical protein